MRRNFFSERIIDWYEIHRRTLPWRKTRDPYKIWLSEIILQQTRVAQGLPYYNRFVETFPTVFDLANATEPQVLRLWQGLGYYTRARNLHRCAKMIVGEFSGSFPKTFEELMLLPGVGQYTAAAIASIAFREPVAVVDGNVFRVLARVYGIDEDIATNDGKNYFFEKANELIDRERPDLFNQALMEFGALQCTPKNPKCDVCIFIRQCVARRDKLQHLLPLKSRKVKVTVRYFYYFIIIQNQKVMMKQRRDNDIWKGLNDFYLIETTRPHKPESLIVKDEILSSSQVINVSKNYTHILSHQKLMVRFITIRPSFGKTQKSVLRKSGLRWLTEKAVGDVPKPILVERFLKAQSQDREFW